MDNFWFYVIVAVIIFLGICFGVAIYGVVSGGMFSELPVKNWTISEAVFYGSVVIGLSIFFSK